jgi:acyl-coenzyme A synthetase/AMP-(fatty) acid ligase
MGHRFESTWRLLYEDRELGAGNFLFKAHEAYETRDQTFLFLERPFLSPSGETYAAFSLDTLYEVTQDLAAWYSEKGIPRGAYVGLYLEEGIPNFIHFLALNSIGCTPALINGNLKPEIALAYADINKFDLFVYDSETEARWEVSKLLGQKRGLNATFIGGEFQASKGLGGAGVWPVPRRDGETVMLCHSSGTTGIPKAVIFTHDQFFSGKRERLLSFVEQDEEKLVTAMPTTHAAGVSYLMTATLLQIPTLSLATQTGLAAAKLVAEYRPTIMTGFPQTFASFAQLGLPDSYLDSVLRFYSTADSSHEAHIRQILRLAPKARFTDMFGASELGMSQFYKVSRAGEIASTRIVGKPAGYAECAILDHAGRILPDGYPGYIGVRSPTITPGYYGQPHLTELTRLNDYWLTGDVGIRKANGEFVHLDRIVDVIDTVLGVKAYTLLLEEHILSLPEVFDATVVGVKRGPTSEQAIVALVQVKAKKPPLRAEELLHHLLEANPFEGRSHDLPRYTLCVAVLAKDYEPPVGSTGKVLKRVIRDAFWDLLREYDQGSRDKITELVWNHQSSSFVDRPSAPHKLSEIVEVA